MKFLVVGLNQRHFVHHYFPPYKQFVFYELDPVVSGQITVKQARGEILALIAKEKPDFVSVEHVHNLKRQLDMDDVEFWNAFFDLDDTSYKIVYIDVRAYAHLICLCNKDKFGIGGTDFTKFYRPGDVYIKNQLTWKLHDEHACLFGVPYFAVYAGSTFVMEDYEIEHTNEHDVVFVGALTNMRRHDAIVRLKAMSDVKFLGGLTDMEKIMIDGKFQPKYAEASTEHSVPRLPVRDYLSLFGKGKLALSIMGLGNNCIRMFEAMAMGSACLSDDQPLLNFWLKRPIDGEHCFFTKYDLTGFEERIREILANKTRLSEVARAGHEFWKKYHTFKAVGVYGNTLLEFMKAGDFAFDGCSVSKGQFYNEVLRRLNDG